ncbi:MAG: hypothetical protein ACR2RA_01775 [Geminicoccaceae bacterium]
MIDGEKAPEKYKESAIMSESVSYQPGRSGQARIAGGKLEPLSVTKQVNEAIAWP